MVLLEVYSPIYSDFEIMEKNDFAHVQSQDFVMVSNSTKCHAWRAFLPNLDFFLHHFSFFFTTLAFFFIALGFSF